jgi:hypothetical protein
MLAKYAFGFCLGKKIMSQPGGMWFVLIPDLIRDNSNIYVRTNAKLSGLESFCL